MKLFTKRGETSSRLLADKIFLRSFIITVLGALVCIVSLSMSTWAWFVASVTSNTSTFEAAACNIDVTVADSNGVSVASLNKIDPKAVTPPEEYKYLLTKDTTYSVKLDPYGTASSCYLKIIINGKVYFTEQIDVADLKESGDGITFTISCKQDTNIRILPRWGTAKESKESRTFLKNQEYVVKEDLLVYKVDKQVSGT